jgi:hypothetical protein
MKSCRECGQPHARKGERCETCIGEHRRQRRAEYAAAKRERLRGEQRSYGRELVASGLAERTLPEVGAALGEDAPRMKRAEQMALAKLRSHPQAAEILELWSEWVAQGKPRPPLQDAGELLLDYELRIVGWYQTHDLLRQVSPEDAARCLDEIGAFHQQIGQALQALSSP